MIAAQLLAQVTFLSLIYTGLLCLNVAQESVAAAIAIRNDILQEKVDIDQLCRRVREDPDKSCKTSIQIRSDQKLNDICSDIVIGEWRRGYIIHVNCQISAPLGIIQLPVIKMRIVN